MILFPARKCRDRIIRGKDERSGALFSYVDPEARVGKDRPLRTIRPIANEALTALASDFSALYSRTGRPSIPPEKLLRAVLLQAFYSIRSERQLMERLEFDLLFRWFVGIGIDDAAWDHSTFSKNRDRLLEGEIAAKLLSAVLVQPRIKRLLSTDHFSVDGTLPDQPHHAANSLSGQCRNGALRAKLKRHSAPLLGHEGARARSPNKRSGRAPESSVHGSSIREPAPHASSFRGRLSRLAVLWSSCFSASFSAASVGPKSA